MTEVERLNYLMQLLVQVHKGHNSFLELPILRAIAEILNVPYKWETN